MASDELSDYDAGLLNNWGGGNVEWWQDYIRAEIGRANDFWRSQVEAIALAIRSEGRREGLEESAKMFDGVAIGQRRVADMHSRNRYCRGIQLALFAAKTAEDAAATIRAMAEKGPTDEPR